MQSQASALMTGSAGYAGQWQRTRKLLQQVRNMGSRRDSRKHHVSLGCGGVPGVKKCFDFAFLLPKIGMPGDVSVKSTRTGSPSSSPSSAAKSKRPPMPAFGWARIATLLPRVKPQNCCKAAAASCPPCALGRCTPPFRKVPFALMPRAARAASRMSGVQGGNGE
eukprot:1160435-Pelagomonas_calceolata.AAC.9